MQPSVMVQQLLHSLRLAASAAVARIRSWFTRLPRWQQVVGGVMAAIIVFTSVVSSYAIVSDLLHGATASSPNKLGSGQGSGSTIHKPPTGPTTSPSKTKTPIGRPLANMKPLIVPITPGKATTASSSDGSITLSIPAGVNATQAATAPAATAPLADRQTSAVAESVEVTQVAPASGSSAGSSGLISFGTYSVQVVDSQGHLLTHGLNVPVTLTLKYGSKEPAVDLTHAFAIFNGAAPKTVARSGVTKKVALAHNATSHTLAVQIPADPTLAGAKTLATVQSSTTNATLAQQMPTGDGQGTPSTVISYDTYEQVADYGAPDPLNVDLNAGSLTEGVAIAMPPGPAGTLPNLTLAYNSAAVSENHSPQGTAGWVGEGWSMSLGSITWSEHNVFANTGNSEWENQWQLTDPFGTSTELLPPADSVSTYYDDTPNNLTPSPVQWHTAAETYDKIYSITSPYAMPYPGGFGGTPYPPCFRDFLPNGVMEEFGCTADSVLYYPTPTGGVVGGAGNSNYYYPQSFLLDLITDPNGNQVHITYANNTDTETGPGSMSYPRDIQMATLEWDSPACVNAMTMCTGANWTPQYRVNFVAGHSVTRLTNTPSGCNTASNVRCDDPVDLTGSGGYIAPEVMNTLVLNDIQVQVNTSGTWNTLRDYQLSYEQSGPNTITDPATGLQESTAGMLDLTQIKEVGTDGTTAYPATVMSYASQTEYYEDGTFTPYSTTVCGPSWNTGGNGGTCDLWSTTYNNNSRYLSAISNGQGLQQTITWANARNNTHGATQPANPLYCDTNQTGYPCNSADDQAWSRIVVQQRDDIVNRITQKGQGGTQTTTPIDTKNVYSYLLTYPLAAQECQDCVSGMYWGNENDGDYLDYYNGKFMGFAQASISHPDGSLETHNYYTTMGWGVYDSSVHCYTNLQPISTSCGVSPWWNVNNAGHGRETSASYYATNGTTLLSKKTESYQAVCPPSGITPTPQYVFWNNGIQNTFGPWDGMLVSELDLNNPVADCDVQLTQQVASTSNGTTHATTETDAYTYDSYGRQTQLTRSSNGGTPAQIVEPTTYVWNDAVTATSSSVTGTYLVDVPAMSAAQDGSGNRASCAYTLYDGMSSYTAGQTSSLQWGDTTAANRYTNCGTTANSYTPSGLLQATTAYSANNNGNVIGTTTPDANAGMTGQTNCTVNSVAYSTCNSYDSTTQALPTSSTSQTLTSTTGYGTGAANGFGQWPTSITDANNQQSTMTYDALGRITGMTLPGDTSATMTISYTNWCSGTAAQTPCVEQDATSRLNSTTTVTARSFYDGAGRLVETRAPGAGTSGKDVVHYTLYDVMGHAVGQSVPYFVTAYTGAPGAAAYSLPDSNQAGTTTTLDGLDRTLTSTNPLSKVTTATYGVICGVSGFNDTGCYEQTLTVDANKHQHGVLIDGFGRVIYDQAYTGNSTSTYAVYATTVASYDAAGRQTQVKLPTTGTQTNVYDTAGRLTQTQDPDLGTVNYTYDANGNLLSAADPRGAAGTVYYGYDSLNRQLWVSPNSNGSAPLASWTYDSTANGNNGKGRLTGETFASGPSQSVTGGYAYTYDGRGNQTGDTMTLGSTSYPFTSVYNDAGQQTSLTYPDGDTVTTSLDSNDWLSGVTEKLGSTTTTLLNSISYSGTGGAAQNPTSATVGNATYSWNLTYDGLFRPTETKVQHSSTTLFDQKRGYDAVGNVTSVNTTLPAGTDNQAFCYDEQNRLTWAGSTGTPSCGSSLTTGTLTAAKYTQALAYDVHDRLTAGPAGTYTYGASQLDAVSSTTSGYGAQYDAAGDMTCRTPTSSQMCTGTITGQSMAYDQLRRLLSWQNAQSSPTQTASYVYDGEGNRVQQTSTSSGTTTTTSYLGANEQISVTGSTTTTTKYYSAGVATAVSVNGTISYLVSDALSSVSVALNASGTVSATALYAPYGTTRYSSGTMPTAHAFTGMLSDPSGLSYDNARYYDGVAGQFTSADSVQGPNRYGYVAGNPETSTDPTGHTRMLNDGGGDGGATIVSAPLPTNVPYADPTPQQDRYVATHGAPWTPPPPPISQPPPPPPPPPTPPAPTGGSGNSGGSTYTTEYTSNNNSAPAAPTYQPCADGSVNISPNCSAWKQNAMSLQSAKVTGLRKEASVRFFIGGILSAIGLITTLLTSPFVANVIAATSNFLTLLSTVILPNAPGAVPTEYSAYVHGAISLIATAMTAALAVLKLAAGLAMWFGEGALLTFRAAIIGDAGPLTVILSIFALAANGAGQYYLGAATADSDLANRIAATTNIFAWCAGGGVGGANGACGPIPTD